MVAKITMNIKGMAGVLPVEVAKWRYVETLVRAALAAYDFSEIRLPLVTAKALLYQTMASATIVTKEMFTLGPPAEQYVLRPEGTAMCAAFMLQHGYLRHQQPVKLWYYGPMFRYEQPQKGRLRQFHQLGVESFHADPETQEWDLLALTWYLWQQLQLQAFVTLEINNIGTLAERARYLADLSAFLQQCTLNHDQQVTLAQNPLRLLDTKDPELQAQLKNAPLIHDYYTPAQQAALDQLTAAARHLGIPTVINPLLVRGLDYYSGNVFEWRLEHGMGAQNTVCAGGRYDGLLQVLRPQQHVSAYGCAFGIERILLALEALQLYPQQAVPWTVYLFSDHASRALAVTLRDAITQRCPQGRVVLNWQIRKPTVHFDKAVYLKAWCIVQLEATQISYAYPTQKSFQPISYPALLVLLENAYNSSR